jgi:hypothetical protein
LFVLVCLCTSSLEGLDKDIKEFQFPSHQSSRLCPSMRFSIRILDIRGVPFKNPSQLTPHFLKLAPMKVFYSYWLKRLKIRDLCLSFVVGPSELKNLGHALSNITEPKTRGRTAEE